MPQDEVVDKILFLLYQVWLCGNKFNLLCILKIISCGNFNLASPISRVANIENTFYDLDVQFKSFMLVGFNFRNAGTVKKS